MSNKTTEKDDMSVDVSKRAGSSDYTSFEDTNEISVRDFSK